MHRLCEDFKYVTIPGVCFEQIECARLRGDKRNLAIVAPGLQQDREVDSAQAWEVNIHQRKLRNPMRHPYEIDRLLRRVEPLALRIPRS